MEDVELTPQFAKVLATMRAFGEAGRGAADALATTLGITSHEAWALATSIVITCEDEFPDDPKAAVGFALGVVLGERIGYGRGMEQAMA